MDRDEALRLLRGGPEGIKEWNERARAGDIIPNLSGIDLSGMNMSQVVLSGASLINAVLKATDLSDANLGAANLVNANLMKADLNDANLIQANLKNANLSGAILDEANLRDVNLSDADLSDTQLFFTKLSARNLTNSNFKNAWFMDTIISGDFSGAIGLDETFHWGKSIIDIDTILKFKGDLPEKFLRGCGMRDEEIAYFRAQVGKPIRFYTCFISYSTADEEFASRLYNDFQGAGIRCWKWDKDARTGKSIWGEIDLAIRQFNKLVLVVSESSLKSPYVADEIERAIQKERELTGRKNKGEYDGETDVLFPVRIDDYIFEKWEHERKADVVKKVIADACGWEKDNAKYQRVRDKLIADLKKQSDI